MGVGGRANQGLWIKTRDVYWDSLTRKLLRISENGVVGEFGGPTVPASQLYRPKGLKIGMQFRAGHQVGPDPQHAGAIAFAAGPKGADYTQPGWIWTPVAQDTGVTTKLGEVFGAPQGLTWRGYEITAPMFRPYPPPAPGNEADERLYFRVVIRNFSPNVHCGQYQVNDVHVVPTVCILADLDFASHYALGIGAFTVGHLSGALAFDTQVIGIDVPAGQAPAALPKVPRKRKRSKPKRKAAARRKR